MKITLEPGKYVVAVSGGVDSVALLHLLAADYQLPTTDYQLVVAHFDHGIRNDSEQDRIFVEKLAAEYGLEFYYDEGKLGSEASEATARHARYSFLRKIRNLTESDAIITAHHEDDRIETAFINILRGTGRKGISSLSSNGELLRPLLSMKKQNIKDYAQKHNLTWREDSTNLDDKYLRNHLRNKVLTKMTISQRRRLIDIMGDTARLNQEIDDELANILTRLDKQQIDRAWFISLPHVVAREVLSYYLRNLGASFDRMGIERLVVALKTLPEGTKTDIASGWYFTIGKDFIRLERQSSV